MKNNQSTGDVKRFLKEMIQLELVPALEEIVDQLPDELVGFSDAEQLLRKEFIQLARRMLQGWTDRAIASVAIPRCPNCGKSMRHKGLKKLELTTTLGDVAIRRPRYWCECCKENLYPHDKHIRLLTKGVSLSLGRVMCRMAADRAFARVSEDLLEDYGVRLCKQTIENISEAAGGYIIQIEDERRNGINVLSPQERLSALPDAIGEPGEIAVASCDGVMVHAGSKPESLKNKPDKPGWYEMRAASIAIGNRVDRTNSPKRDERDESDDSSKGHHFRMDVIRTSSFARFESVENIGMDMYLRACEADFFEAPLQCFVSDGATWLRSIAEEFFPSATLILDWYHVMEYVSEAASCRFGKGTADAKRWCEYREAELWDGRVDATLRAIDDARQADELTTEQRKKLNATHGYISGNRDRMDYPRYRALGLPIGSGRAEGLCKTLVEGRLKQSGMRNWRPPSAEAILRLRSARHDDVFDSTWEKYFVPAE